MSTQRRVHRSFRLAPETATRLERRAAETGMTYSGLAERLLEEGLRRERHPAITFIDRATGRRAHMIDSRLDVLHVIETIRLVGSVDGAADQLQRPIGFVQAAADYYAEFADEIESDIERYHAANDRELEAHIEGLGRLG